MVAGCGGLVRFWILYFRIEIEKGLAMAGEAATLKEGPNCKAGVANQTRIDHLEESDRDQWGAINALRNRLPIWATAVISLLSFLAGGSMTYATLATKIAALAK